MNSAYKLMDLRTEFRKRKSEIQRINTGDLPINKADPELIRNMAQYHAILNSNEVAEELMKLR